MEYISLGSTCSIAFQKQKLGIKKETYPFDWLRVESLDDINDLFDNSFQDFLNLTKVNESDKFPVFDEEFPNLISNCNSKSIIMKNKYEMKFYHDFNDKTNFEEVRLKYERRIERLINLIKSDKPICFIRDELKPNKINNKIIDRFVEIIKSINPKSQFELIIILHQPKNCEFKQAKIIVDNQDFGDWTRPNLRWHEIFNL